MYTMALMQDMMLLMHLSALLEKEWQKQQMIKKTKKFKKRIHQYRQRLANKKRHQKACAHETSYSHEYGLFSTFRPPIALKMNYTY